MGGGGRPAPGGAGNGHGEEGNTDRGGESSVGSHVAGWDDREVVAGSTERLRPGCPGIGTFPHFGGGVELLSHVKLCDSMDCSPPSSSVHGILQARILEWVAMASSKTSSRPRGGTHISCIAGRFFTIEPPEKLLCLESSLKVLITAILFGPVFTRSCEHSWISFWTGPHTQWKAACSGQCGVLPLGRYEKRPGVGTSCSG